MQKLLIVDDSAPVRDIIRRLVQASDVDVENILEAGSGEQALELLEAHPDISVVLTDLGMPEMDGLELLSEVRQQFDSKQLPVVALTLVGQQDQGQMALERGANEHLCKPFSAQTLSQVLGRYAA